MARRPSNSFSGMKIDGGDLRQFRRAFQELGPKVANQVLRSAVTKAAKPVVKDAKARATDDTGLLKLSIGTKVVVKLQKRRSYVVIGPRFGVGKRGKSKAAKIRAGINEGGAGGGARREPAFYAHLVEFGTRRHGLKKAGVFSTGDPAKDIRAGDTYGSTTVAGTRPRPFLRPAFQQNKREVLKLMSDAVWDGIAKQARKLARRAA